MNKYGIYLISDPSYDLNQIELVLCTGKIKYLQYRNKYIGDELFVAEGLMYKQLCEKYGVKLIINDRIHLVSQINADGIHVGQQDASVSECKQLDPDLIVGVSVTTIEQAQIAVECGADYIGVGAMFPTTTKEDAKLVSIDTLRAIHQQFSIDIVTIGGITTQNAPQIIAYCDGLAICSSILAASQPVEIVDQFAEIIGS